MRLPRFRLRTLLIAVAIAGLACGGGEMLRRRRANLRQTAQWHRQQTELHRMFERFPPNQRTVYDRGIVDRLIELEVYHIGLAEKYERLARYPWLPVPPDPPEPE